MVAGTTTQPRRTNSSPGPSKTTVQDVIKFQKLVDFIVDSLSDFIFFVQSLSIPPILFLEIGFLSCLCDTGTTDKSLVLVADDPEFVLQTCNNTDTSSESTNQRSDVISSSLEIQEVENIPGAEKKAVTVFKTAL